MGRPLEELYVVGQFGGSARNQESVKTDAQGVAVIESGDMTGSKLMVTFTVDAVIDFRSGFSMRPIVASRVDRLSYQLFANMGQGLASSAIVLDYPTTLWTSDSSYINSQQALQTYVMRPWGTGLASSAMVVSMTPRYFFDTGMHSNTMLFTTFGTGLASSAIVLDQNFFNPSLTASFGAQPMFIRHFTAGTGLASSAIVFDNNFYSHNHFFTGLNPSLFTLSYGNGLASSAIVFDSHMFNPMLWSTTWNPSQFSGISGVGLASSAIVFDYTPTFVSNLGFSWNYLDTMYPGGVGLASSAMVNQMTLAPYMFSGSLLDSMQLMYFGMSEQMVAFTSGNSSDAQAFQDILDDMDDDWIEALSELGDEGDEEEEESPASDDSDGDGVLNADDVCPNTMLPEAAPTRNHRNGRFAATDTSGSLLDSAGNPGYTLQQTGGCSCEQVVEAMGADNNHLKKGCQASLLDSWISGL